jgi:hypothetical protein
MRDWEEPCVCGHKQKEHTMFTGIHNQCAKCTSRWHFGARSPWHEFKLDNLRLIEDLAKHKGLV